MTGEPFEKRGQLLRTLVTPKLPDSIRYSETLETPVGELIEAVREQDFEGIIANRRDSTSAGNARTVGVGSLPGEATSPLMP